MPQELPGAQQLGQFGIIPVFVAPEGYPEAGTASLIARGKKKTDDSFVGQLEYLCRATAHSQRPLALSFGKRVGASSSIDLLGAIYKFTIVPSKTGLCASILTT